MVLSNGKYYLMWNDFEENSSSSFKTMRNDNDFTDVTLACDDNQDIKAHKMILSTSSLFFNKILRQQKHLNSYIYLRGVKNRHLVSILDFMYHGEVSIPQEDLEELMLVAKELQVKGLEGDGTDKRSNDWQENNFSEKEIPQTYIENMLRTSEIFVKVETSVDTIFFVSEEHVTGYFPKHSKNIAKDLESLDMIIDSMIQKAECKGYTCKACGIPKKTKQHLRTHVEGKHVTGFTHLCPKCNDGKGYRSRKSLTGHQFKKHNMSDKNILMNTCLE